MKCFAIFVCVIASTVMIQGLNMENVANMLKLPFNQVSECLEKHEFSSENIEIVETILQGKELSEDDMDELVSSFGCFIACVYEKPNIIVDDKIAVNKAIEIASGHGFLSKPELTEVLKKCAEQANEKSDKCEVALTFSICVFKNVMHQYAKGS